MRRDIRNRLNEKKQKKKLMPKDERLAAHRIDRISDELRGVHDKYTEIKKAWLGRYADVIEGLLRDNTDKYADALLACLAARNVPKDLISIIAREDERFQLAAPKKSIWRFWQKKQ